MFKKNIIILFLKVYFKIIKFMRYLDLSLVVLKDGCAVE